MTEKSLSGFPALCISRHVYRESQGSSLERNLPVKSQNWLFSAGCLWDTQEMWLPADLALMNSSCFFSISPDFLYFQLIFLSSGVIIPANTPEAPGCILPQPPPNIRSWNWEMHPLLRVAVLFCLFFGGNRLRVHLLSELVLGTSSESRISYLC